MAFGNNNEDKKLAKKCQKCNAKFKKDAKFCSQCGAERTVLLTNRQQQEIFTTKNEVIKEVVTEIQEPSKEIQPETISKKTKQEKLQPDFSDITKQLNEINNKLSQFSQLQSGISNLSNMQNSLKQLMTSCFENQQSNLRMPEFKLGLNELYNYLQQQIRNSVEDIKRNIPKNNDAVLQQHYEEILDAITSDEHQNELMSKQYQEIQKLRGNFYADLMLPAISDTIEIIDDAKRIFSLAAKESDYLNKMSIYENELKAHIVFSDGKLKSRSISTYESRQQDRFDDSRHKIIAIEETPDRNLHNKVAESVNSGYIWNISDSRKEIIRKEEVKVFQYNELLTKKKEIK